jgi:hypothetical protein
MKPAELPYTEHGRSFNARSGDATLDVWRGLGGGFTLFATYHDLVANVDLTEAQARAFALWIQRQIERK